MIDLECPNVSGGLLAVDSALPLSRTLSRADEHVRLGYTCGHKQFERRVGYNLIDGVDADGDPNLCVRTGGAKPTGRRYPNS